MRADRVVGVPSPDVTEVTRALRRAADALPGGGESRPGQVEMAQAVARAIETGRSLVVQAGTGTGKSLAYLVPAVLAGVPVVVATATKALQDQLATKDLPLLADAVDQALLLRRPQGAVATTSAASAPPRWAGSGTALELATGVGRSARRRRPVAAAAPRSSPARLPSANRSPGWSGGRRRPPPATVPSSTSSRTPGRGRPSRSPLGSAPGLPVPVGHDLLRRGGPGSARRRPTWWW